MSRETGLSSPFGGEPPGLGFMPGVEVAEALLDRLERWLDELERDPLLRRAVVMGVRATVVVDGSGLWELRAGAPGSGEPSPN